MGAGSKGEGSVLVTEYGAFDSWMLNGEIFAMQDMLEGFMIGTSLARLGGYQSKLRVNKSQVIATRTRSQITRRTKNNLSWRH